MGHAAVGVGASSVAVGVALLQVKVVTFSTSEDR